MPLAAPVTNTTRPATLRSAPRAASYRRVGRRVEPKLTGAGWSESDDIFLGGQRPFGFGFWPLPEDDPGVEIRREAVRIVTDDARAGARHLVDAAAGSPGGPRSMLTHPRGDFSVHYACPLLAAAGFAVLGFSTRYLNNDTDCLHDAAARDVAAAAAWVRARGAEAVVLLGNSGGGSLMALAQAEHGCGDGWVGVAAHPGEGVFMLQAIDPSVADEQRSVLGRARARHVRPGERLAAVARACAATTPTGSPRTAPRRSRTSRASTRTPRRSSPRPRTPRERTRVERGSGRVAALAQARRAHGVHDDLPHARRPRLPRSDDRPRRPAARFAVRVPRSVRRELRARRARPHDDDARLALDVVGAVVGGQARRHDAGRRRARRSSCTPTADTEIRRRQARAIATRPAATTSPTRRSRAHRTTSRDTVRRRWSSSRTGSRARFP